MNTKSLILLFCLVVLLGATNSVQAQYYMPMAPPAGPMMLAAPYGAVPGMMMAPASFPTQQTGLAIADGDSCEDAACDSKGACQDDCCDPGCNNCCPCQGWCHKVAVFGEFLYLRPRDAEVAYAVEVNSAVAPPTPPVQVGPLGVADPDYEPAYRAGATFVLDAFSSVTAQYTMFESSTFDQITLSSGILGSEVVSLLVHPTTQAANSGGIIASAQNDITFDLIDVDYRQLFSYSSNHHGIFLVGVRYADLEQELAHATDILRDQTVVTDIDFEGLGLRLGLEGEGYARNGQLMVYAKAHCSLMAGEFKADYDQGLAFDASQVDTAWEAGRIVPILDLEVGVGWMSQCGNWRLSAGYAYSAWFNVVKTDEFIKAVQGNNFVGMEDALTFDGLVARVEARF